VSIRNYKRWSLDCEATSHTTGNARTCAASETNADNNYDNDEDKESNEYQSECSENITEYIKGQLQIHSLIGDVSIPFDS
jgi:hypothetical protein